MGAVSGVVTAVSTTDAGEHRMTIKTSDQPPPDGTSVMYKLPTDAMLTIASDAFGSTVTVEPDSGTEPRTATKLGRP